MKNGQHTAKPVKKITPERFYRRSVYYRISNLIFWLVSAALLVLLVIKADEYLSEYQLSRPDALADDVISAFENGDYELLLRSEDAALFTFETEEDYLAYAQSRLNGKLSLRRLNSDNESIKRYAVYCGGEKQAELTLRADGKTKHGMTLWTLENVKSCFSEPTIYTVTAQESSCVYVNDILLGEEYITQSNIKSVYEGHLPIDAPSLNGCIYTFGCCFKQAEITVEDAFGNTQTLTNDGNDYNALINFENDALSAYDDQVQLILRLLAGYSVGLSSKEELNKRVVNNSDAADIIYEYGQWKSTAARRGEFKNQACTDRLRIDENRFCARVTADYICTYQTADDCPYTLDYLMFFEVQNGYVKLYDFTAQ